MRRRASAPSRCSIAARIAACWLMFSSSRRELSSSAAQVKVSRKAPVQVGDRGGEAAVRGRVLDRLVEEVVRPHPRARVAPVRLCAPAALDQRRDRATEELLSLAQPPQVAVADQGRCELRREPFELGPHLVALSDVPGRRPAHDRAAIGKQLDDPGRLELAQRFADGRAADLELLGERLLPQARADGDRAAEDLALDRRGEPVDEGRALRAPESVALLTPAPRSP